MSPLFAALPPTDLPTHAYVPPTAVHGTAPFDVATSPNRSHTVRPGDTVYDIAARYGVGTQAVVRANSLSDGGRWILPGDVLRIPGGSAAVAAPAATASTNQPGQSSNRSSGGSVTVRAGDTLSHIAARHGVSVGAMVSANQIQNSRLIFPGQVLTLPGGSGSGSSSSGASSSSSGSSSSSPTRAAGSVTVRAGDTLSGLAARHGSTVSALARANQIADTRLIYPGQVLRLPGTSASSGSSSSGSSSSGSTSTRSSVPSSLSRPYDEHTIGDLLKDEKVQDTFLHYQYSSAIARAAAANRIYLGKADAPSRDQLRQMIIDTSNRHGVDPKLMLAISYQESGWNQRAVSPANAIGAMQVIPTSGQWASSLIGRDLNLLEPQDNVTAGVVVMRALLRSASSTDHAIGGYYQGLGSVRQYGLFADTRQYVDNIRHFMRTL